MITCVTHILVMLISEMTSLKVKMQIPNLVIRNCFLIQFPLTALTHATASKVFTTCL